VSKTKEAKLALEDFIRAARDTLDALEELTGLCPSVDEDEDVIESRDSSLPVGETGIPTQTATLEEVRFLLAEKARTGFRAEVKALLTAHGAKQLSDITDPVELGVMLAEAEKIGG